MADQFQCGEYGHAVDKNGSCTLCDFRLNEREREIVDSVESGEASRAHNEPLIAHAAVPPSELLSESALALASAYGKSPAEGDFPESSNEADMALPQKAQEMVDRVRSGTPAAAAAAGPERIYVDPLQAPAPKSDMLDAIDSMLESYVTGEDLGDGDSREVYQPPRDAPRVVWAVWAFACLVDELWRGDAQMRPMMLGRDWVARWLNDPRMAQFCGLKRTITGRTAGNALEQLVSCGVLTKAGEVKIPGKPRPAYLYELVPVEHADDRVDEIDRPQAEHPHVHAVDEPLMPRAVVAVVDGPLDAAESGTRNGVDGVLHSPIMPHAAVDPAPLNAIGGPL